MPVLRAHLVQIKILENHQNGKDTHLRGLQIFARNDEGGRSPVRAGRVTAPWARTIVTDPASSGSRSPSRHARGNSGSSSRNKTPRCARLTSPGRVGRPPPSRPATETVWCGMRTGARRWSPTGTEPAATP